MIWNLIKKLRVFVIYRILRLETRGVRIILSSKDKILLIKHPYDNFWVLPGGGIKRKESVYSASKRELLEETGYEVDNKGKVLGIYHNASGGKNDYVTVYIFNEYISYMPIKSLEVQKMQWFNINSLPKVSEATERRIDEYINEEYSDVLRSW